ncbi:peroxidase [Bythopirellula polymerisocia]|uniref:Peroxidase n=2 Tax=Bythopirellula polymerisocia TaxID=2528003 RepID=A0A5C6CYB9_9BACT|nr:peroxidase [Bythopirellula polymerisocia]
MQGSTFFATLEETTAMFSAIHQSPRFPFVASFFVVFFLGSTIALGENRSIDGTGNNLLNSTWGAAGTNLARMSAPAYDDGISTPRGSSLTLPNPRDVSNMVVAQAASQPNAHSMTGWVFQWGQFVDHDLDLTGSASPSEPYHISIPAGDPIFDPGDTGTQTMSFNRSNYDTTTGTSVANPRQQINQITSYLDASNVYGSDGARAAALRTLSGGRLKTSAGDLLPLNTLGLANDTGGPADPTQFYVAGDVRANEQVGLTAIHTLFMREHNRLADEIAVANPLWDDEQIYQRARKLVGAQIQAITYQEFLPALLGSAAPDINSVYDPGLNASILNEFSTALYRVGHTMLPQSLMRMQNDGSEAPGGAMELRDAFFLPQNLAATNELEYHLKGLASEVQQDVDMHMVDDVRNFLFGIPVPGGFDLASLNIQRGRDHGLPDYNSMRVAFGLSPKLTFADISSDLTVQTGLQSLYGTVDEIDAWVGALSEDHVVGCQVGELIAAGLVEQFTRARDGDRFWYTRDEELSGDLAWLSSLRLSDIIRLNSGITNLQDHVFFMAVPEPGSLALALLAAVIVPISVRRR